MRERTPASRPIIERLTRFRLSLRNTSTAAALTAAALGSSRGEGARGLFGELLRKLEVRTVPRIRIEDQPGTRWMLLKDGHDKQTTIRRPASQPGRRRDEYVTTLIMSTVPDAVVGLKTLNTAISCPAQGH